MRPAASQAALSRVSLLPSSCYTPAPQPPLPPAGLLNMEAGLTNVCYQNALVQALAMTGGLTTAMLTAPLVPLVPGLPHATADSRLPSHLLPPGFEDPVGVGIEDDPPPAAASATRTWSTRWSASRPAGSRN